MAEIEGVGVLRRETALLDIKILGLPKLWGILPVTGKIPVTGFCMSLKFLLLVGLPSSNLKSPIDLLHHDIRFFKNVFCRNPEDLITLRFQEIVTAFISLY